MNSEPAVPETLREAQKRQTKALILHSAARLFAERGFTETTISDIAQAVGASRATIYAYFPSKDDIAGAIVQRLWDDAEELYAAFGRLPDWTADSVRGWAEEVVARWESNYELTAVQFAGNVTYDDFYVERHRGFVAALMSNAELWQRFTPEDGERRALLLIGGLGVFMNTWQVRGWQMDRAGAIDTLVSFWRGALGADS